MTAFRIAAWVCDRRANNELESLRKRAVELAEANAALRNNEERLRLTCHAMELGTHDYNPVTGEIFCNERVRTLCGIGCDVRADRDLFKAALHPEDAPLVLQALAVALDPSTDGHFRMEFRIRPLDGASERWVRATGRSKFEGEGSECRAVRFVGTVQDIAIEKEQQQLLRESEEHFWLLHQTMLQGVVYLDADEKVISMNPAADRILGRSPADFLGIFPEAFAHHTIKEDGTPFPVSEYPAKIALATGREQHDTIMGVYNPRTCNHRWISVSAVPLFQPGENRPYQVYTLFDDITEREHSGRALRESEERYHRIVEKAQEGIWSLDFEGKTTYVNPQMAQMLGYTVQEMLGCHLFDFMNEEDRNAARDRMNRRRQGIKETYDFRLRHKNGRHVWMLVSATPVYNASGKVISQFAMVSDITERKKAEEALQRSYTEIKKLKDQLQAETEYLKMEVLEIKEYGDIIGRSKPFLKVLKQVEQVAATDASVVIMGETGTGKELIARKIHKLSRRGKHTMVCINCASLPAYLVESELFGREKGAYTGALTAQAGRFEVANESTLFLDEVGELPFDMQAKLLRVLQNGEFERLGSTKTVRVDVRIIAATNKDLAKAVADGKFRQDLYYRLNVYPIRVPPLRERPDDIPLFVNAFVAEFAERLGKTFHRIAEPAMQALKSYHWPSNVRELRNVIEHAVIVSDGTVLSVDFVSTSLPGSSGALTLEEVEAAHIQAMLERAAFRIKGPGGAAAILGLEPSTLYSRMKKLGIATRIKKDDI